MKIDRIKLKNWKNFQSSDVTLKTHTYIIGANASGKSNFLDVFRFLRSLAQTEGGGLQKAIRDRGGLTKLRSLHARRDPEMRIEVDLSDSDSDNNIKKWQYVLALKSEGKGKNRVIISKEEVMGNNKSLLNRPDNEDRDDPERLTQTHLEQISSNGKFRKIVDFFASTIYLHLVPQLLKFSDEIRIGTYALESDPFGQGLMQRIAKTSKKIRDARLKRIEKALSHAVPLFSDLRFEQDQITGLWHLEARFKHWRVHGAWQREDQFSDGTLRLIGLLWALQEGDGLLLLEEPELSLNDGIVEHIPLLIDRVLKERKKGNFFRQVLISTHSSTLLSTVQDEILLVEPSESNGSTIRPPTPEEAEQIKHGLTAAEVMLPKTHPQSVDKLGL